MILRRVHVSLHMHVRMRVRAKVGPRPSTHACAHFCNAKVACGRLASEWHCERGRARSPTNVGPRTCEGTLYESSAAVARLLSLHPRLVVVKGPADIDDLDSVTNCA